MKYLIIIIMALILLTSCGKSENTETAATPVATPACANHQDLGTWYHQTTTDTLTFSSNCSGTSTVCESDFLFSQPNGYNITMRVIRTNASSGCLSVGDHVCTVKVYPDEVDTLMAITCENGPILVYHTK